MSLTLFVSFLSSERAANYANEMRLKLQLMDEERMHLLSHPSEGILFLTHEIEAVCLEHFDLVEFPYDTQVLDHTHSRVHMYQPHLHVYFHFVFCVVHHYVSDIKNEKMKKMKK
jgi:hypothetical protein